MPRRQLPEINAGSMADIAFLLLIFFIVATTMEVDTGLLRRLPPPVDKPEETPEIKERNVFVVLVNKNNDLLVEGERTHLSELKDKTIEFLLNPKNKDNLPEKKQMNVEFFGTVMVPQGVISLQNDRGTNYETYIKVQDALLAAGNEVRDRFSYEKFGKPFDELTSKQQKAITSRIPVMISEAEPKHIK
ncbi:MAG: ExbD/TolR family protein [Bacteroidota bacterium]